MIILIIVKPIANRWVWGRCLSKLRELQASMKVTMTTLRAATTRHRYIENLPEVGKSWEPKGFDMSTSKDNAFKMT